MALGQALDVYSVADSLFRAVVDHFAARTQPEYADLPERRYLATGDSASVAWDCEQFTVSLEGIGLGTSQDAQSPAVAPGVPVGATAVRHAVLMASLVRCVPTLDENGDFPEVDDMAASGALFFRDAGLLSQAMTEWASQLRRQLGRSAQVRVGDVLPAGPEGAFAGLVCSAQISVTELL